MSKSNTEYKSNSAMRRRYEQLVAGTCIFGIIICLYTIKVEVFKSYDSSYKALCDFNEWISCSKVFTSKYGKGFGLMPEDSILNQPNGIFGLTFFTTQLVLVLFRENKLVFQTRVFLSVLSIFGSVYLAYILYFVLQDFCIVCVSTYVVNVFLIFFNYKHYDCFKKYKAADFKKKYN